MKKLVTAALFFLGVAQLSAGCFIEPADEAYGNITASWSLLAGDANLPTACPPGATTINVKSLSIWDTRPWEDLFYCEDGIGTTFALYPDTYDVWVELTDDSGETVYAMSGVDRLQVFDGEITPVDFEFSVTHGAFDVSWNIVRDDLDVGCADIGAETLLINSSLEGDTEPRYQDMLFCDEYEGTTAGLPINEYIVEAALVDGEGNPVAVVDQLTDSIDYGNHFKYLGHLTFDAPTVTE